MVGGITAHQPLCEERVGKKAVPELAHRVGAKW
jgi:hypothetical protein